MLTKLKQIQDDKYSSVNQEKLVDDAATLLIGAHDSDRATLASLDMDGKLRIEDRLIADVKRTTESKKLYATESFQGNEIKALCEIYDLKLLKVDKYKGPIPAELPRVVDEFAKKHEVDIISNNFFILAPTELFDTDKYTPPKKDPDPILFYRLLNKHTTSYDRHKAHESDTFAQLLNWGDDFKISRKYLLHFNTSTTYRDNLNNSTRTFIAALLLTGGVILGLISHMALTIPFIIAGAIILMKNLSNNNYNAYKTYWNRTRV